MKGRVCIIRHDYYPRENHVRRDAEAVRDAGYQVDIICSKLKNEKNSEIVDRINVYRMPISHQRGGPLRYIIEYPAFFILSFIKLTLLHLEKKYAIIEVDTMPDFLIFVTVVPKLLGAKTILYMFEAMPEIFASKHKVSHQHLIVRLLGIIERIASSYADRIITVNEVIKKVFVSRKVPASKIVVILNSPDEEIFKRESYVNGYMKKRKCFVLVCHGTILKRYGFQTAIKAVSLLRNKISDLRLEIVGNGEYIEELVSLVNHLNLEDVVNFRGYLSLNEIPNLIMESDIGLVPIAKDNFTDLMLPNKLFEYIALGRAVISSNLMTIRTYFNNDSILFFESNNEKDLARCIFQLYQNPAKRRSLVANATRIYEKYRWSKMKKQYLKVYEGLTNRKQI